MWVKGVNLNYTELKKFLEDSDVRWKPLKDAVKKDREFISGKQFEDVDNKIVGTYRLKDCVNIVQNSCNSITNNYSKFPYSWFTDKQDVNSAIDSFLNTNSNGNASVEALYNAVSFGVGVMTLSTDYNQFSGQIEPIIYSINDIEKVYFDPSMTTLNGQDAMKAAIVEIKSKLWVKDNIGQEFVADETSHTIYNAGNVDSFNFSFNSKLEQPVITYYEKANNEVYVYTFTGGKQVGEPQSIRSNFIPVLPVFGELTWDNGKPTYQGIVRKTKSVQKLLNYCYMQLCERLAISPKNVFMGTREQFKGVEQYWRDSGKNLNPLLLYNGTNKKGETLAAPVKVDNTVRYDDLSGIMATVLDMITSITGVQSTGLADDNKTATASVLEHNAYSNNVSHFYNHLKQTFKLAGTIFCQMLSLDVNMVEVIQGVDELHQNVEARQVLSTLLSVMPDKANIIVNGILSTYPQNTVVQNTLMALNNDGKSPREIELEKALEETTKQLEQAQNQNVAFEKQLAMEQMKLDAQVTMHHEDNQLKALIEDNKSNTDIQKELIKVQADSDKQMKEIFADAASKAENL